MDARFAAMTERVELEERKEREGQAALLALMEDLDRAINEEREEQLAHEANCLAKLPLKTSEWNDSDPVDGPSGSTAIAEFVMSAPALVPVLLLPALPATALGFPVSTVESMPIADDPLRDLAVLCHRIVSPDDYLGARVEYCRLSVQLNVMGRLAPAFRPQVDIKAKSGHPVHTRALRDRLVIDYHWCHATNMNLIPSDALHRKVFAPGFAFSFEAAWELSGKNWRGVYRGYEALALTDLQQCQTVRLHGPELIEREKKFSGTYRDSKGQFSSPYASARRKIGEWAETRSRMKAEQRDYVFLWRARELLGAGRAALIPDLLALMLGEAVRDRKTIRDKLALLDKHVKL